MSEAKRLLLGPQRPVLNLPAALRSAGLADGPFAVISAGWQEAEGDLDELQQIVGQPVVDLRLYGRTDEVFAADPELAAAYRERQDKLKELQRLYRLRLRPLSTSARQMLRAEATPDLIEAERRHSIAQLRALDRHHLRRTEALHAAFSDTYNVSTSPILNQHAGEIAAELDRCRAVLITGGNIVVLLNRMRLFGLADLLANRHVVGWSAGAMVQMHRIVLYHDRTPEGRRDAELLGAGMGLVRGFVVLPDAAHRLRERDRQRVGLLSRRLAPACSVTLDSGASLLMQNNAPVAAEGVRRLHVNGHLRGYDGS